MSAVAAPVPISAFVEADRFARPRLSPDGKHLAVTVRIPDKGNRTLPTITIYTVPAMQIVSTTRMPVHTRPHNYYWVSNRRLIITQAYELGSEAVPVLTGEVTAMNIDGTRQEYLYGHKMAQMRRVMLYPDDRGYGEISAIPPDLNEHFLLQEHQWRDNHSLLYDVDTNTGIRKILANLPVSGLTFVMQHDGKPRFAYGRDDDNKLVLYERDAGGSWNRVAAGDLGADFTPIAFEPDGSAYYATYSPHGGPAVLIRQDTRTGARTTLASHPSANMVNLQFGPGRNPVPFAAMAANGRPQWIYFNEQSPDAQLHKSLSASFPDETVDFLDFSDDGRTLLFSVYSDRDPGSYYLYDRSTNKADLLFTAMEQLEPEQMAERRHFAFKARDGMALDGFLTMPKAAAGKPALIVMPHGGPHGVYDTWFFDRDAQFLASRGYAVLQVNFRGSGGRGPAFRQAGWRQWGARIQDDLVDGVRWAAGQGVDTTRVCTYGASFGGYSALMLPVREPNMFRCAVGYAGIYDLSLLYKGYRARANTRSHNYLMDVVGTDEAELERQSPARNADKIKIPVLLVHGKEDEIAPPQHAEVMRDALTAAGHAPEWMMVEDEGHGFFAPGNRTAFYQRLEAFLARHLGK